MDLINKVLREKDVSANPIWIMRQAGRYLPEFREIRKKNPNFIKLCLNAKLSAEISLQPLKRFDLDAAIVFSDILMIPYGLNQTVEFEKNIGPILGDLNLDEILNFDEQDFIKKVSPVYDTINLIKKDKITKNRSVIGFVGAPWTLLLYMLNKKSPKKNFDKELLGNKMITSSLLNILNKFIKIHIKNQIKEGAQVIQIFDSWAGLLEEKELGFYVYEPTLNLVEYTKSLNIPVICFPRGIKDYQKYCEIVNPTAISIDYDVDPKMIDKKINLPVQGGLDPKILLADKDLLKKKASYYLDIFRDRPYIFNLGHGILPETNPDMLKYLIDVVKNQK